MAFIQFLITLGLITAFFFGQLFRLNFHNLSIPLIDVFIVSLTLINIIIHFTNHQLKTNNKYFIYFLIFAWISFFINFIFFHYPIIKPILYLIRLTSLLSLFIYPPDFLQYSKYIKVYFVLSIIANIIFGLIQYLLWPDFTSFRALNWDPHLYRLVSTFFDPTFTGLIYLFFFIYLYFQKPSVINSQTKHLLMALTYLGLALTYSRSTSLSLVIASLFVSRKIKKPVIFMATLILVLATILILPRQPGEGTKLERTSSIKAKIENYQEGIKTFLSSPLIGHGYDNLFYVRQINIPKSHSNFGFDGSLLTILATTGLIGFCFFLAGSVHLFRTSSLLFKTFFVVLFVHSLFANSLLYPWTLVFLILI